MPNALLARTWIRSGTVRYVVLTVPSPQAFIDLGITATKKTRLIAIVPLPAPTRVGPKWGVAIATAAGDGPDLAVSAGSPTLSPTLGSYLGMLKTATTHFRAGRSRPSTCAAHGSRNAGESARRLARRGSCNPRLGSADGG